MSAQTSDLGLSRFVRKGTKIKDRLSSGFLQQTPAPPCIGRQPWWYLIQILLYVLPADVYTIYFPPETWIISCNCQSALSGVTKIVLNLPPGCQLLFRTLCESKNLKQSGKSCLPAHSIVLHFLFCVFASSQVPVGCREHFLDLCCMPLSPQVAEHAVHSDHGS